MQPTVPSPATAAGSEGLSAGEAARRLAAGLGNQPPASAERSGWDILARNTLTRLNFLFAVLGVASLATGAGPDATFLAIAVINTAVGTIQELRAKRALEALAVINAPRVRVLRDGVPVEVPPEEVVVDDVLELAAGDQVVADAVAVAGRGEVDESLATGESEPVAKAAGADLLSGTWLVSGSLRAMVTAVGAESYAGRLAGEARQFSLTGSELMAGINTILRWLSFAMIVIGPALVIRQLQVQSWRLAVRSTVAGLVGMIPEGLVLLTTLAFLTAAVRLGGRRVLVQELPAVETLARVDSLCTDKTGTLTDNHLAWGGMLVAAGTSPTEDDCRRALAALAAAPGANATLTAIAEGVGPPPAWAQTGDVPFSSARKWSAGSWSGEGTWVLGAPEMVTATDPAGLGPAVRDLATAGNRVLVLARTDQPLADSSLPEGLALAAVVHLRERLRPDATATLGYFARQQVTVRVVSGDSAATVGAVAAQVGLAGAGHPVDARSLPVEAEALAAVVEDNTVFGRVTPEQKRSMVEALRSHDHVIAMTGDGVNDTLALKTADLGIAMGTGSAVARGVAQLVLLDNQFEVLPSVVSEGRRVLHNVERVASLFLVKNMYSIVISVVVAIAGWPYPFLPRHLTLISGLAIGIPGFFLALAPSDQRFHPGFVRRVTRFSALAGTVAAIAVLAAYAAARSESTAPEQARTAAVMVAFVVSMWVLVLAARPLRAWKLAVVGSVTAAAVASFVTPGVNSFFSVQHHPDVTVTLQTLAIGAAACAVVAAAAVIIERHTARPGHDSR